MTTSETSAGAGAPAVRREHAAGVLGTTLALLVLALLLLPLALRFFRGSVDGAERVATLFGSEPPPFGLALADATRLPTGDVIVRLARPEGATVVAGAPDEVVFMEYASPGAVEALFRPEGGPPEEVSRRLAEWEKKKDSAWRATLKQDEIAWGAWRSRLAVVRAFQEGGGWREEVRVDLSRKDRPLVLFAHWPAETPFDEGKLKELLGAIVIPEEDQDT
jgi:hypothetical protein